MAGSWRATLPCLLLLLHTASGCQSRSGEDGDRAPSSHQGTEPTFQKEVKEGAVAAEAGEEVVEGEEVILNELVILHPGGKLGETGEVMDEWRK